MSYIVEIDIAAARDIIEHERSGRKAAVKKIKSLLPELENHPRTGTGKPERLRHMNGEFWSRRIDHEHRLVYEIQEDLLIVIAVSAAGHYKRLF